MRVKAKIVSALQCGLKVLDEDFEELKPEQQEGGTCMIEHLAHYFSLSDSEDEDDDSYLPGSAEPILEPKDMYSIRALPLRIGTPAFLQEDDVGLGEYASSESEGDNTTNVQKLVS